MDQNFNENQNSSVVSNEEKQQLKNRISQSFEKLKRRKKHFRYLSGAAAAITILLCVGIYFNRQPVNTSISDYVNSTEQSSFNDSDKVTVILNEGDNIVLDGDDEALTYSKTGSQVSTAGNDTYSQNIKKDGKINYNTILVPYGKRSNVTLSDGSKVWLNSGSKLVYPAVFTSSKREVYLEGEAIFDVAHNASNPFVVLSKHQEVEVLGTVFNVSSYPDDQDNFVVLKSGSVQVSYNKVEDFDNKKNQNITITPGTLVNLNLKSNRILTQNVNVDQYFSWRDGLLILKNNDLSYITRRLSRYYNVPIVIENKTIANETFSGYLDLNENLEKVIQTIQIGTDFNYEIKEDKIIINKIN